MSTPQQSGSTTTVVQQAVAENTDKRDISGMLKRQLQQSLAFGTLVVLVIFFAIASPAFFTVSNLTTVLLSTAVIAILALGTTFVIITGGIDLSLGTGMALCAVILFLTVSQRWAAIMGSASMACVLVWLWCRPEPPADP